MATAELTERREQALAPVTYTVTIQQLEKLEEESLSIRIANADDKDSAKLCYSQRQKVRRIRLDLDEERKAQKEEAQKRVTLVDSLARPLRTRLEAIEKHLQDEEDKYEAAKQAIIRAAEEAKFRVVQDRIDSLLAVGCVMPAVQVQTMNDKEFSDKLAEATEAQRAAKEKAEADARELARLKAEEEERQKAEAEKLRQERAELEKLRAEAAERQRIEDERQAKIRAEQQAEEERIAAERRKLAGEKAAEAKRVADAKAAEERKIEAERIRKETEARIERETKERIKREAEEAKSKAERAEAKRLKAEAMRPDKEKLLAFTDIVRTLETPKLSDASKDAWFKVKAVLDDAALAIEKIANSMEAI